MTERNRYTEYALDVVTGTITAGKLVRQACERYLRFFDRYDFRPQAVDRVVAFIYGLKHWQGRSAGQPFKLLAYQRWMICAIFGFYHRGTDRRVCHYVYIELARKQGKTALAAAILLYMLVADGEHGSEVELVANSRKQAGICFEMCSKFARSKDPKRKFFELYRDTVKFGLQDAKLQVLSSDAGGNDGYNSYAFVLDECHEQQDSKLWDVMTSSQGQRVNYLAMIITTAGLDKYKFCYQYRRSCVDVLAGVAENDSQFCAIYTLDEEDAWDNPLTWVKSNPSLGVTVSEEYLHEQIRRAKISSVEENGIRTKNLNQWVSSIASWIPYNVLLEATQNLRMQDFEGLPAYIGVDLSTVSDMSAVSVMVPMEGKYYFWCRYYLPESALSDNVNAERYKEWKRRGFLQITPGNVIDYEYITADIKSICEVLQVERIAYDKWNAIQWATQCTEEGLPLVPYSQTLGSFNLPTKEMERLLKSGKAIIDNNEITRWCFENVRLKYDHNDNVKPDKGKDFMQKIDGVIAMIQALGVHIEDPYSGFGIL